MLYDLPGILLFSEESIEKNEISFHEFHFQVREMKDKEELQCCIIINC